MSGQIQSVMIALVGGLLILAIVAMVIPNMAGISLFSASSSNLVSSGQGLSELIPTFAVIIGVGVLGFIVQKR